jgi:MoaA/NifB/PqqE/SkfB family radical SAM enzyme
MSRLGEMVHYGKIAMGAARGKRPMAGPLYVTIGITDLCNYQCVMCREFSPHLTYEEVIPQGYDQAVKKMDLSVFTRTVDDLYDLGTRDIRISGRGEPFIHPQIMEMIEYVTGRGMLCSVTTNGSLLNEKRVRRLVEVGLYQLHVSMNATTPESYEAIHVTAGGKVLDRIKNQIGAIRDVKRETGRRAPLVTLSYVLTSVNFREVEDMVRLAVELKADRVTFQKVVIYDEPLRYLGLGPAEEQVLREQLLRAQALADHAGLTTNIPDLVLPLPESGNPEEKTKELYRKIPCYVGYYFALINTTGQVNGCCQCLNIVGDVRQRSFKDIWNSEAYQSFREQARNLPSRKSPVASCLCHDCAYATQNLAIWGALHPGQSLHLNGKEAVFSIRDVWRLIRRRQAFFAA